MTREELKEFLISQGYQYERDEEYNQDTFTNSEVVVDGKKASVKILADRLTVKIVWRDSNGGKVGSTSYISKLDEGVLKLMIKALADKT